MNDLYHEYEIRTPVSAILSTLASMWNNIVRGIIQLFRIVNMSTQKQLPLNLYLVMDQMYDFLQNVINVMNVFSAIQTEERPQFM